MEAIQKYNEFVKKHQELLHEHFTLCIEMAKEAGIKPSDDYDSVARVSNVIGSEGDSTTRALASLAIGALKNCPNLG